jgi:hypothetical protein
VLAKAINDNGWVTGSSGRWVSVEKMISSVACLIKSTINGGKSS